MSQYRVVFSRHAQRGAKKLARSPLKESAEKLIEILRADPFQSPPPYESLKGDLHGSCKSQIPLKKEPKEMQTELKYYNTSFENKPRNLVVKKRQTLLQIATFKKLIGIIIVKPKNCERFKKSSVD